MGYSEPAKEASTPGDMVQDTQKSKSYAQDESASAIGEGSDREHITVSESSESANVTIVDWDGPKDPQNPKNWPYRRKWSATIVVSSFTFISPISSSMMAPATADLARELNITSTAMQAMAISIFVLGYAVGPLILGPLSEIFGRSRVLQLSNLFYLAWNTGCGFAQTRNQLIAFRFLSGLGGSAPLSIGGGVIGDGQSLALYVGRGSTWRWVFWSTSIVDVAIQISGFFFLQETFAPLLLERKAKALQKPSDDVEKGTVREVRTIYDAQGDRSWKSIFAKALTRPFALFARESIVQLLGLYMAFIYGIFYLALTTLTEIFRFTYNESIGIAGLNYIALGIGLTLASQLNARALDRIYVHFKNKNNGIGEPELRLPPIIPGSIILPIGLLLAGWAADKGIYWIATDIGIALIGAGMILCFQGIQTYVVDTFTLYAASALAAVLFLRSLAGFGFPLFAPSMYEVLGYGKGNTILAALSIGIGCPAPFLFWKYGKRIRMHSKYSAKNIYPHSQPQLQLQPQTQSKEVLSR
ncbi:hypothetical protein AX16_006709 [Volvariella volvacea WC 439]|nr:hypothetical protein AX16_006709 [Volvariella volvacea WC 439]